MEYLSSLKGVSYLTSSYCAWLLNIFKNIAGHEKSGQVET